jgi:xanthosine utilization system XapX-like protein
MSLTTGPRTDSAPGFWPLDAAARPEKAALVGLLGALLGEAPAAVAERHAGSSATAFKAELAAAAVATVAPVRAELAR